MQRSLPAIVAAAAVGLMSSASSVVVAQAQDALSIANNDSIYIDGNTFKVSPGKAKGDPSAQIKKTGARELGPGAIVFRAADKLYIMDAAAAASNALAHDPSRPYAYDPGDARRFANDPARPYAYDPGDARRFAVDPSRPYAYDPGDARRFAVDPSRPFIYVNDPDYAHYRLKKLFDENWTAVTATQ